MGTSATLRWRQWNLISVWKKWAREWMPRSSTICRASREKSSKPLVMSLSRVPTRRQHGASVAEEPAPQRAVDDSAAGHEAAAEHAIVAPLHGVQKPGDIGGPVREARVDLQDEVVTGGERFAIAADVGVGNRAILGGPHDAQARFGSCEVREHAVSAVAADIVEDRIERGRAQFTARRERPADEAHRGAGLIGHRADDPERSVPPRQQAARWFRFPRLYHHALPKARLYSTPPASGPPEREWCAG